MNNYQCLTEIKRLFNSMSYFKILGTFKGLTVILDAHNDIAANSSIDEDDQGFVGMLTGNRSFPLTYQSGFQIKPGHTNLVNFFNIFKCILHKQQNPTIKPYFFTRHLNISNCLLTTFLSAHLYTIP